MTDAFAGCSGLNNIVIPKKIGEVHVAQDAFGMGTTAPTITYTGK
jgi:hypothetical protein